MTRARRRAAPAALATTVVLWASAFAAIREAVRALGWAHLSVLRLGIAAPAKPSSTPPHPIADSRSPNSAAASSAVKIGATLTSRLAVAAGTVTSPAFRKTW